MSAIIVLPVIIPAATAAWPVVVAAATAAASAMGYAAVKNKEEVKGMTEVELPVESSQTVTENMALGEELVFTKGDVEVVFYRNTQGQVSVKVRGCVKSEQELRAIGQQLSNGLVQQYAYHQLMTELKQRNFNVVGEEVEEDGTVRLQVRIHQG